MTLFQQVINNKWPLDINNFFPLPTIKTEFSWHPASFIAKLMLYAKNVSTFRNYFVLFKIGLFLLLAPYSLAGSKLFLSLFKFIHRD